MWKLNYSFNYFKRRIIALSSSKKLFALLTLLTWKHDGDFYRLSFLHLFKTKSKLESHKKACTNKDFLNVIMNSENNTILGFNQYHKSDKNHLLFM